MRVLFLYFAFKSVYKLIFCSHRYRKSTDHTKLRGGPGHKGKHRGGVLALVSAIEHRKRSPTQLGERNKREQVSLALSI